MRKWYLYSRGVFPTSRSVRNTHGKPVKRRSPMMSKMSWCGDARWAPGIDNIALQNGVNRAHADATLKPVARTMCVQQ